jgi:hypothetical protein
VMMHQTLRLVELSDKVGALKESRDPLRLLFLLICTECVEKLYKRKTSDEKSRKYVKMFFSENVSTADKKRLRAGIWMIPPKQLTVTEIVDLLYYIRCDVVHQGHYWGFSFADSEYHQINLDPRDPYADHAFSVRMSFKELREIIVNGCIAIIKKELKAANKGVQTNLFSRGAQKGSSDA